MMDSKRSTYEAINIKTQNVSALSVGREDDRTMGNVITLK